MGLFDAADGGLGDAEAAGELGLGERGGSRRRATATSRSSLPCSSALVSLLLDSSVKPRITLWPELELLISN